MIFDLIRNKKSLSSQMIISGICKPLSMIVSYLYIPLVLNYLGTEKYGVWATILTIVSWVSFFDIGIGNGLRNKLTESLSKKDGNSKKLVSSAYAIITVIISIVTLVFCIFFCFVDWNSFFKVENAEYPIKSSLIISVVFLSVNFILSLCKNILFAYQQASKVSLMELFVQIINFIFVFILTLTCESNLFFIAVSYGFSMLIVNLVATVLIFIKQSEVKPELASIDFSSGKQLMNLGLQFFIIQICALILFTTDNLIISFLYGAENVTPYVTVNKLFSAIIGVYSALLVPIWSAVTKSKTERNLSKLKSTLKKLNFLMVPFFIGTVLLVIIFRPLTELWLKQRLAFSTLLICLGGIYCILSNWCNTYATFANGLELMKMSMIVALVQAVVNIPMSLFFAKYCGLKCEGILMGTVFSMLIAAIVQPIYVYKKIRGNYESFI